MFDPLSLASRLIAIPSVNPMGGPADDHSFEGRMTAELVRLFQQAGVAYEVHEVSPGRANVIARVGARTDRPTILFEAHQDTVPVAGMTIPPFEPAIRDGRLYGRGSCDVKGGMAAMLAAFFRIVNEQPPAAANLVMACTCDEESTATGVAHLVRLWGELAGTSELLSAPPTAAVITEPTNLDIVVAHRGVTRWAIRTTGRACHSSDPTRGVNAIYRMSRVLSVLEDYAIALPGMKPMHALCGPSTLSVGRIQGGQSVNIVPDLCEIEIDRRSLPGEDPTAAMHEVMDYVCEGVDFAVETSPPWLSVRALADTDNAFLARSLHAAIEPVAGRHKSVGVAYGTDASTIAAASVPSVVFGPGSINQAHTADEWLPIHELEQAAEVLFRFAAGASRPS